MSDDNQPQVNRRSFLRGIGVSAAAVPALAVAGPAAAAATAATAEDGSGYRETDHVRRAYDAARF